MAQFEITDYKKYMNDNYQDIWVSSNIHKDLLIVKRLVYDLCKFKCSQPVAEPESAEYGAFTFRLNNFFIKFRVGKTTPTKEGQFLTLWKRMGQGPIQPHDISDEIDLLVVSTRENSFFGQFVFPKSVLRRQGILSVAGKEGKRAFRVYPPWDHRLNRQAQKTQNWQVEYFLDLSKAEEIDYVRAQMLYSQI